MFVKIHKSEKSEVVAICDEDLIGKTICNEDFEVKVSEHFYKGEVMEDSEVVKIMKNATNLNIIGERSIGLALESNIIDKDHIIRIKEVPHAQIFPV